MIALFLTFILALPSYAQDFPVGGGFGIKPAKANAHFVVTQSEPSLPNSSVLDVSGLGDLTSFDITNNASSLLTFGGVPDTSGAVAVTVGFATGQTANRAYRTDGSGNAGLGQIDLSTSIITGSLPQANVANLVSDLAGKQASDTQLGEIAALSLSAGDIFTVNDSGAIVRLAGGSDTNVLTYDASGNPNVKWAAPSGGLTNPMTTTGDIIYSSDGSGTPARLAVGSNGKILRTASGLPAYSTATYPNTCSSGDIIQATGSNVFAANAPSFAGSVITSGAVSKTFGGTGSDLATSALTGDYAITGAGGSTMVNHHGGSAVTPYMQPANKTPRSRREMVLPDLAATAHSSLGLGTLTQAGTPTRNTVSGGGDFIKFTTGTTSGNTAGVSTPTVFMGTNKTRIYWHIRTPATMTSIRIWCNACAVLADYTGAADPSGGTAFGFRYDSAADSGARFRTYSNDGSGTGLATDPFPSGSASAGTDYWLMAEVDTSVAQINFFINGTALTSHSTNLPGNTALLVNASVTTLTNAARELNVGNILVESYQ